ncbi:MAG: hypothetical protein ACK5P5_09220 [Pseudobdellovibrionaceae bacterium]|jgi:hypothetical protein
MKNQNGFVTVFLLATLPVIVGLIAAVTVMTSSLNLDQQLKKTCREELIRSQENSAKSLDRLFNLNPMALKLRFQKHAAQIALAAAVASLNQVAIAKYTKELLKIERARQRLHRIQQTILQRQNIANHMGLNRVQIALAASLAATVHGNFFTEHIQFTGRKHVGLAVEPDQPDTAPIYELQNPFEEKQTLSIFWKWKVQGIQPVLKKLSLQFQRECSVTLIQRNHKWQPLLRRDKLLLRD